MIWTGISVTSQSNGSGRVEWAMYGIITFRKFTTFHGVVASSVAWVPSPAIVTLRIRQIASPVTQIWIWTSQTEFSNCLSFLVSKK